jgi:hypothetical protein
MNWICLTRDRDEWLTAVNIVILRKFQFLKDSVLCFQEVIEKFHGTENWYLLTYKAQ